MLGFVDNLKIKFSLQVQYLCCKNSGKNHPRYASTKWVCPVQVCYLFQPGTCHDGHIKHKFATFFYQVCAMLNGGKFASYLQSDLWAEAANTAMILENNLITPNRILSPFQHFFGKGKKSVLTLMQKFGEMCIITYKDNTDWAKLANHGTPGIWVGYAENSPASTYWIFSPKTKKIFWPGMWLSYKSPIVSIPGWKTYCCDY